MPVQRLVILLMKGVVMTIGQNTPPDPSRNPEDPGCQGRTSDLPGDPGSLPARQPSAREVSDFKTARTLATVASVAGPVSVFFGGMPLSVAGAVCGAIALRRFGRLAAEGSELSTAAARLMRSSVIGLIMCVVAFALNAYSFFTVLPEVLQMMEFGELDLSVESGVGSASGQSATWG